MYLEIRCQEEKCPYGKGKSRCCFGEIEENDIKEEAHLRHKCKNHNSYVNITMVRSEPKPAA